MVAWRFLSESRPEDGWAKIRSKFLARIFILSPNLREAMTVLEPGPGMGFFTLPLARMVGPTRRVMAVDLQPKMIPI